MQIPTDYRSGFAAAALLDAELAERYVRHTMVGDPPADAVIAELACHPAPRRTDWIRCGIEGGPEAISDAPAPVRAFFADIERVPSWFDPAGTRAGCRAFHRNSEMFIGAFVAAVLIEGFATLISKSFSVTGRLVDQGARRLKQNNRHLVEIFLPGGLDRRGEGWKLSVRIRLIHAQVRRLLGRSDEWHADAWGTPLSAAHIGFATAAFSALLLERAEKLGVSMTAEERDSFMSIWRYSGHLMGVVPELLFETEAEARHLHRVGAMCEPPPGLESIILANGLINSAPIVAGIDHPGERRKLVRKIYGISRALIGDDLADALRFAPGGAWGTLAALRWRNRADYLLQRLFPAIEQRRRVGQFQRMIALSFYRRDGIGYRVPDHVHAEKDGSF